MQTRKLPKLGVGPFKELVRTVLRDSGLGDEEVATSLGFGNTRHLVLYLDGKTVVAFPAVLTFADKAGLDRMFCVRCWMVEYSPALHEFLEMQVAPPLLSMNERRLISHLREFTEHSDASLVVADGRDLLAVVMV